MAEAMTRQELTEQLAAIEHDRWGHWMRYLLSQSERGAGGSLIIPAPLVERWQRQANTPYSLLTEREQQSDRAWAQKLLPVLDAYSGKAPQQEEIFG